MIKLEVEDYCHDCPRFEAVTKFDRCFYAGNNIISSYTIVECKNKIQCAEISKYIEKELNNGENK